MRRLSFDSTLSIQMVYLSLLFQRLAPLIMGSVRHACIGEIAAHKVMEPLQKLKVILS